MVAGLSRVRQRRRHHLLKAAQRVFLRDGWPATTMEAVAAEAGISKQTLYNYFPDKARLFVAMIEMMRGEAIPRTLQGLTDGLAAEDVAAALQPLVLELFREVARPDRAAYLRMLVEMAPDFPEVLRAARQRAMAEHTKRLGAALDAGARCGRLRPVDGDVVATLLWGAVAAYGLLLPRIAPDAHRALSPERMAAGVVDLICYGIQARDSLAVAEPEMSSGSDL